MDFELHIKNIGKLGDAKISIGQFTVFAGPNNTGKSYVSKLLYSTFNAMNANLVEVYVNEHTNAIIRQLMYLKDLCVVEKFDLPAQLFLDELTVLQKSPGEFFLYDMSVMNKVTSDFANKVTRIIEMLPDVRASLQSAIITDKPGKFYADNDMFLKNRLQVVEHILHIMKRVLTEKNVHKAITNGLEIKIKYNLINNFQIPELIILKDKKDVLSEFNISNMGKFSFEDEKVNFRAASAELQQLQQYSKVIYLESPIYWKLKIALEDVRPPYVLGRRKQIGDVPGYFYDLARSMKYKYTGDIAFPKLYKKLIRKDVLGGKIDISDIGNLSFLESGRSFPLSITAMGVTNLGILALLIERKVLDKGTFLFIDEPEAHLHPAWQVTMAEVLFDLAKGGVNVVIATHSIEILKWLEVHIKKNPDYERLVALNMFSDKGVNVLEQDFTDKISAIKEELTKPFADLYVEGL